MNTVKGRVLLVDDKETMLSLLARILSDSHAVTTASDGPAALALLHAQEFDVVLTDVRMPGSDGFAVVRAVKRLWPATEVVMMTAFASIESAVEAIKLGAYDYLRKPFDPDEVALVVARALERKRLREQADDLRKHSAGRAAFGTLLGRSASMQRLFGLLHQASQMDITVLLCGESGTGKEAAARALHAQGGRGKGPFVPVSCNALAPERVGEELFAGWQAAHGGTLFLDEVAQLPLAVQVKVERALGNQEIGQAGAAPGTGLDVRLIAATRTDLRAEVAAGRFREDLFYRLQAFPVPVPPLRLRQGDLALLAQHFLEKYAGVHQRQIEGFEPDALQALLAHGWPGNVRELENTIERAVAMSGGPAVGRDDLALEAPEREPSEPRLDGAQLVSLSYKDAVSFARDRVSREYLAALLRSFSGNVTQAAERAGIERESLHRLLKRYDLRADSFRDAW